MLPLLLLSVVVRAVLSSPHVHSVSSCESTQKVSFHADLTSAESVCGHIDAQGTLTAIKAKLDFLGGDNGEYPYEMKVTVETPNEYSVEVGYGTYFSWPDSWFRPNKGRYVSIQGLTEVSLPYAKGPYKICIENAYPYGIRGSRAHYKGELVLGYLTGICPSTHGPTPVPGSPTPSPSIAATSLPSVSPAPSTAHSLLITSECDAPIAVSLEANLNGENKCTLFSSQTVFGDDDEFKDWDEAGDYLSVELLYEGSDSGEWAADLVVAVIKPDGTEIDIGYDTEYPWPDSWYSSEYGWYEATINLGYKTLSDSSGLYELCLRDTWSETGVDSPLYQGIINFDRIALSCNATYGDVL